MSATITIIEPSVFGDELYTIEIPLWYSKRKHTKRWLVDICDRYKTMIFPIYTEHEAVQQIGIKSNRIYTARTWNIKNNFFKQENTFYATDNIHNLRLWINKHISMRGEQLTIINDVVRLFEPGYMVIIDY